MEFQRLLLALVGVLSRLHVPAESFYVTESTSRPIIGILTVDADPEMDKVLNLTAQSKLPTSYVKYVEMGGARVVPIFLNRTDDYYEKVFKHVNGILFPGGGVSLNASGYAQAATRLYRSAVKANDDGHYFPLWGTCLGFEMLVELIANTTKVLLVNCTAQDVAMPLEMTPDFHQSRLFRSLPSAVLNSLTTKNVTGNYHKMCLRPPSETSNATLWSNIHILSTNTDSNVSFVSTFEDKRYPFYGIQWHPEKNNFEWTVLEHNIPHALEAIQVSQYFANFFVQEARKNNHRYDTVEQEEHALISNYNRDNFYFLHNMNTSMREVYVFLNSTE